MTTELGELCYLYGGTKNFALLCGLFSTSNHILHHLYVVEYLDFILRLFVWHVCKIFSCYYWGNLLTPSCTVYVCRMTGWKTLRMHNLHACIQLQRLYCISFQLDMKFMYTFMQMFTVTCILMTTKIRHHSWMPCVHMIDPQMGEMLILLKDFPGNEGLCRWQSMTERSLQDLSA